MSEVINLTDANFDEEVLKSTQPVLVDFYAQWCGPCKIQGPIIDEVAKLYAGKAKIAKADVDEASQKAAAYGVSSVPSLMIFKDGKAVKATVGVHSKESIGEILDTFL